MDGEIVGVWLENVIDCFCDIDRKHSACFSGVVKFLALFEPKLGFGDIRRFRVSFVPNPDGEWVLTDTHGLSFVDGDDCVFTADTQNLGFYDSQFYDYGWGRPF